MASPTPAAAPFPTTRAPGCPFDPPQGLAERQAVHPITRLAYPDGHVGWLATGHAAIRAVLTDPRFSARSELIHMPFAGSSGSGGRPAPAGSFISTDPPVHTRYRRLLTGQFTVRRMRQLTERIEDITAERLDVMARRGPVVDLVEVFAHPVPAQVICEVLGVPYADRTQFLTDFAGALRADASLEDKIAAYTSMSTYLRTLVAAKRARPTDDMLSGLTTSDLSDEELANLAFMLLGAGLDTTANMIGIGAFALLQHPEQLAVFRADPTMTTPAVEELLRYLSVVPGTVRAALEDVEVGGVLVKKGEPVTVSIPAGNRDPAHFADPDTLDLRRSTGGHLAFGHGVHQCIGQQLARVEMQVALPALFARFPDLRLAVVPDQVRTRDDMLFYGVYELPVTWDVA